MLKVMTVVGARPQFIKASALSKAFIEDSYFIENIVHTNQHYDYEMSEHFFGELEIPKPTAILNTNHSSNTAFIGSCIIELEKKVHEIKPNCILVYGDTNSTMCGAIVANKLQIPLVHIEAGLRSYNKKMQEENNRVITDHLSDILFCSSTEGINNLTKENIYDGADKKVILSGDLMYDAALIFKERASQRHISKQKYALLTLHRAENVDSSSTLRNIIDAISKTLKNTSVIFPIHPRTAKNLKKFNISLPSNFKAKEPLGYLEMLSLVNSCEFVLTDSGGLQKEAYFMHKYCITLRNETEWNELVEQEKNTLVGANEKKIEMAIKKCQQLSRSSKFTPIYGDGNARKIITTTIKEFLN